MDFQIFATLGVILLAIILFVTEKLSVDLIALVIICSLVIQRPLQLLLCL